LRSWVLIAQVPSDYARRDPEVHLRSIAQEAALVGDGVAMMTAASVRAVEWAEDEGVLAAATVGLSRPTLAAAWEEQPIEITPVGTINVVVQVPEQLSPGALVNAVITATEAKSQALRDLGLVATGTASDAICVLCPSTGPVSTFAGPRSVWGARLARAVYRCVLDGGRKS
jgi:adenosylcobinamide hydrolase